MKKKKAAAIFRRELKQLLFFLIIGGILILFNQDHGNWKFPMAMTLEWRARTRFLGRMILYFGYPLSILSRFFLFLVNKKGSNHDK